MSSWSRFAMARSCGDISAIEARTALSPSVLSLSSRARALIAAFSSAVNPSFLVVVLADFCVAFFGLIVSSCSFLEVRVHDLLRDDHCPGVVHERSHLGLVDRVEPNDGPVVPHVRRTRQRELLGLGLDERLP